MYFLKGDGHLILFYAGRSVLIKRTAISRHIGRAAHAPPGPVEQVRIAHRRVQVAMPNNEYGLIRNAEWAHPTP